MEPSRSLRAYIPPAAEAATSLLLPPAAAANSKRLLAALRGALPRARGMQAAIARHATRLQWAYSDLGEGDHKAVGPDALDVALWAMTAARDLGVPRPRASEALPDVPDIVVNINQG
jgi:hypothetical protein